MGTDGATIASLAPGEEGTIQVAGITDGDTAADPMDTRVGLKVEEGMAADMVKPTAVVMEADTAAVVTVGTAADKDMVAVAIGNRL
jgi:hypothetical protein